MGPGSREGLGERVSGSPAARCVGERLGAVEGIEERLKSGDTWAIVGEYGR